MTSLRTFGLLLSLPTGARIKGTFAATPDKAPKIDSISDADGKPIRMFRIRWAWRYGNRTHFATTTWGARSAAEALRTFGAHKPSAISASIVEEVV